MQNNYYTTYLQKGDKITPENYKGVNLLRALLEGTDKLINLKLDEIIFFCDQQQARF
jgi:hypothetical protein